MDVLSISLEQRSIRSMKAAPRLDGSLAVVFCPCVPDEPFVFSVCSAPWGRVVMAGVKGEEFEFVDGRDERVVAPPPGIPRRRPGVMPQNACAGEATFKPE